MSGEPALRFRDFVDVMLDRGGVLYEAQERSLVSEGITKFDLGADQARGVIAVVVGQSGHVMERDVSRQVLNVMRQLGGKRAAVDRRRFEQGVRVLIGLTEGRIAEPQARAWLKRVIEASDLTVRGSGLLRRRRWFRRIKVPPAPPPGAVA